jgi:chromosome segregation ATPase
MERIAGLEKSIASLEQEKMDLLTANEELKANLADVHSPSRMQSLQQELQIAIAERDDLQKELDLRASENDHSDPEIYELQAQLKEYQNMIEVLQQGADEATQTINELQDTKILLEESIAGLKVDGEQSPQLVSLQKALDAHILTEKQLRSQITSLVFQVDKAEEEDTKNHQEIARLKGIVESQTVSLQELESKLFNVENTSSEEIESLLLRISELENAVAVEGSSEPIQSRLLHYRSEAENFRKENQELKERLTSLDLRKNAGDELLIEELKMINENHLAEIEILRQQARRHQQAEDLKLVQLETEIEERDGIIDQLEDNAHHQTRTPSERSMELENLKKQMSLLKEKHTNEVSAFKAQISALKSNAPQSDALLVDELQAINEAQITELQKAEREIKELQASHAQEIQRLQSSNTNAELLNSLQDSNEEQMFELETLRIKLAEQEGFATEQAENAKQEIKDLEAYYQTELRSLRATGFKRRDHTAKISDGCRNRLRN